MATQYESDLLAQGVSQAFIDAERAKGKSGLLRGSNVDAQDVNPLLAAYRATGNEVFSSGNIASTTQNPLALPNYNDPLGYLERIKNETGFSDVQKNYLDSIDFLRKYDEGTAGQQNTINDALVPTDLIRGRKESQLNIRSNERTSYANKAQALQDLLTAKSEEVNQKYKIFQEEKATKQELILQYPKAGIQFTDSIESIATKLGDYQRKAEKDAYKAELKKQAISLGIKTKGKNTKALEKSIRKYNKSAVDLAKQEANLKIEGLKLDLQNTKSLIANRGAGGSGDSNVRTELRQIGDALYNIKIDKTTGDVISSEPVVGGDGGNGLFTDGGSGGSSTAEPGLIDTGKGYWNSFKSFFGF